MNGPLRSAAIGGAGVFAGAGSGVAGATLYHRPYEIPQQVHKKNSYSVNNKQFKEEVMQMYNIINTKKNRNLLKQIISKMEQKEQTNKERRDNRITWYNLMRDATIKVISSFKGQ